MSRQYIYSILNIYIVYLRSLSLHATCEYGYIELLQIKNKWTQEG